MIIWLASYPKSGNTWVRSMIAALIHSNDGVFNFELLKNIQQFPEKKFFKDIINDFSNFDEIKQNWIEAQERINLNNQINLFKTHQGKYTVGEHNFTNNDNTLGVIYIVRDPRNVVTSYSHHFQKSPKKSLEELLTPQYLGKNSEKHCITWVGSWKYHYNSWKVFDKFNRYCLIRYEDLINNTEKTLLKILKFIAHVNRVKFVLDKNKFENTLNTTTFEKMKNLEAKETFDEAKKNIAMNRSAAISLKYGVQSFLLGLEPSSLTALLQI